MNFSLTPALEKYIRDCANSGEYSNASEVVRDALRLFKQHKDREALKLKRLRKAIKEGDHAFARGDCVELADDKALASFFADLKSS